MLKRFLGPLVLLLAVAACTQAPPAIQVTVSPADGAENVLVTAVVTADFNVAMNASTVNGAFTLSSAAGEVAGVLSYDDTLRRATFTPSTDLAYDTEYTAAVAGTIRSAAGGRMPIPTTGEYAWSFSTEADPGVDPAVTSVEVTPATAELGIGDTQQFEAEVTAVGGASVDVTWSSSDEAVATVDDDGLVTAVAEGIATITATSDFNASVSGSATVTVAEDAPVDAVTSVEVSPNPAGVLVGQTTQLSEELQVTGSPSLDVTWSSSNEAVATVSSSGLVTGVAPGEATITATSVATPAVSGSATVLVSPVPAILDVSIVDPGAVYITDVVTLEAIVLQVGGLSQDVTWSSDDDAVATIDEETGELTAVSVGEVLITATSVADGTVSDSLILEVLPSTVTDVAVSPESATLDIGDDEQFTADVTAFGGADESVTWSSDDEAVATVDADGLVTAVGAGSATITATSDFDDTVFGSATVDVVGVTAVTVDPATADLAVGGDVQLTADATAHHGASTEVTWESDALAVATVDAETGLVTAVGAGTATITAFSVATPTVTGTAEVTVYEAVATDDYADAAFQVDEPITAVTAPSPTGGLGPFGYALTDGDLPDGLAVDPEGTITGTPSVLGPFSGEITVTDSLGQTAVAAFAFVVVEELVVDADYAPAVGYLIDEEIDAIAAPTFDGGADPVTFAVSEGVLPPGLTLGPDGTITGTPTTAGTYEFTVTATDFSGQTVDLVVEIEIADPLVTTIHVDDTVDAEEDFSTLSFIVSGGLAPFTFETLDPLTDPIDPSDPMWASKNPGVLGGWTLHPAGEHGALPAGYVIEDEGTVSGTSSVAGFSRAYVRVTDALGQTDVVQAEILVNLVFFYSLSTVEYPTGYSTDALYRDCNNYAILVPGTGQAAFGFPDSAWTVRGHTGTLAFSRNVPADGLTHTRWIIGASSGTLFRQYVAGASNTNATHNGDRTYTITVTDGGVAGTGETATFVINFDEVAPASWTPAFVPGPHTPCA